jgi:hypothetical protein
LILSVTRDPAMYLIRRVTAVPPPHPRGRFDAGETLFATHLDHQPSVTLAGETLAGETLAGECNPMTAVPSLSAMVTDNRHAEHHPA